MSSVLPRITDKINLPTSVTAMETFSRLLRVVKANEPLSSSESKPLFMAAKARGIRRKAAVADTHTEGTLKTFGLISYVDDAETIFQTTPLGKAVADAFDESGPCVDSDQLMVLSLRVVCAWHATNTGRDIHPGRILLDLLCDEDVDGYVTEHEYTNFLIDSTTKLDNDYNVIKKTLLEFRAKGAGAICTYTETCKTYLFLPAFVNKWHLLKKGRVFDFDKKGSSYRWTMGALEGDEDSDETQEEVEEESLPLFSKWSHVTEYRLLPKAKAFYINLRKDQNGNRGEEMKDLQKIVYGAPGTGKSFDTDKNLVDAGGNPKAKVFRTTFHPDSDYSTFVGAYKPTSIKAPRIALDGTTVKKAGFGPDITADQRKILEQEDHITYSFRPQAFMNAYVAAWKDTTKSVVLIIEEINRGNCAQIFGDLFQLLDRDDKSGYSMYPITADTDLKKWLAETEQFGPTGLAGITKPERIKQPDWDQILRGEMLALPPNLYIWATMNTSDQSLFPIDSAFKRRWDWKYVPIREGKFKNGQPMKWKVKFAVPAHQENGQPVVAKDYTYDWWDFLKCVNALIFKTTDSEDKKLGYFFVKPDSKTKPELEDNDCISADRFVSKVIFYLWNDVFKDYGIETIFKVADADKKPEDEAKGVEFQAFFNEDDDHANVNTLLVFFKHLKLKSEEEKEEEKKAAAANAQNNPGAAQGNPPAQGGNANPET